MIGRGMHQPNAGEAHRTPPGPAPSGTSEHVGEPRPERQPRGLGAERSSAGRGTESHPCRAAPIRRSGWRRRLGVARSCQATSRVGGGRWRVGRAGYPRGREVGQVSEADPGTQTPLVPHRFGPLYSPSGPRWSPRGECRQITRRSARTTGHPPDLRMSGLPHGPGQMIPALRSRRPRRTVPYRRPGGFGTRIPYPRSRPSSVFQPPRRAGGNGTHATSAPCFSLRGMRSRHDPDGG